MPDAIPIAPGPTVMLRQVRQDAQQANTYHDSLEAIQGQCMLCRIHGMAEWQHRFAECRQVHKWRYIDAKKEVLRQTRQKWVRHYDACFYRFQPPELCHRRATGRCLYDDLVMQTVFGQFAIHEGSDWWIRHFEKQFEQVEQCLIWVGSTGQLGNIQCVRGVEVLWAVLQEWRE